MRKVVTGVVLALLATVISAATEVQPTAAGGTEQFPVWSDLDEVWSGEPGLHGRSTTDSFVDLESVYEAEFNSDKGKTINVFRWCVGDISCQNVLFRIGSGDRRHTCHTSAGRFCSRP